MASDETDQTDPVLDLTTAAGGSEAQGSDPGSEDNGLLETGNGAGAQRVPVNMYETDQALVIVAPMPGVMPDDIEIVVEADRLTLRAQLRTAAPKNYIMHEWDYGDYERSVPLPTVFRGDVTARLGNGQLAVSVAREGNRPTGARVVVQPNTSATANP